jgi:glycopeptide antibiotics resistance protein
VVDVTLVASIASVLVLTLPPSVGLPRAINLVPFAELRHTIGNNGVSQLAGNAVMFMPFGFLLPLRWPRTDSLLRITAVAAAFSVVIELLQFILPTGRQTSFTDVLMNSAGAAIGYLAMVVLRIWLRNLSGRVGSPGVRWVSSAPDRRNGSRSSDGWSPTLRSPP